MGRYTVKFIGLSVTDDGQKQMVTAQLEPSKDGSPLARMYPARWFFRGREDDPTTEVALRRGLADDLYIVLGGYEVDKQTAVLQVKVNPLVNWIWFGVGIMAFGTIIALLPERALAFATSKVPESAVTTSLVLLLILGGSAARVHAQHIEQAQTVVYAPKNQLEKDLRIDRAHPRGQGGRSSRCRCAPANPAACS